jgi:ArsR family transcriptional regulator, arsenate/arsenite/antimonite-responsive transcriptional repressor
VPDTTSLLQIYQCFCDETRLRIVNLLSRGPLCVCHLQTLLEEAQVKISKHLGYLRAKGLVDVERHQNWMIYSLPKRRVPELEANLRCLQDCVQSHAIFKSDLRKLDALRPEIGWLDDVCGCVKPAAVRQGKAATAKAPARK